MSEYIDRMAVIKWIDDSLELCGSRYTTEQENMMEMFRTVITDCIPAAEVRPVVTCADCKYNKREVTDLWGNDAIQCITGQTHRPDWFCADGKKREATDGK